MPDTPDTAPTLAQALQQARSAGLDLIDAQQLLLLALDRGMGERAWLIAHDTDHLPPAAAQRLAANVQRRLAGEPFAYIAGEREFFGLSLRVDARVLVPRPDTETLVEWALDTLDPSTRLPAPRFLDLGTGSGAIALAVKSQRPGVQVSATDASEAALAVARANAQRLGLPVDFHAGNWLAAVPGQRFHTVASNPPYIARQDAHLPALRHEPLSALASGADGLDDLRRIVATAPAALWPGGWLLLEHGHDQASAVRALLQRAGFTAVHSRRDLAGIERCSGGQSPLER